MAPGVVDGDGGMAGEAFEEGEVVWKKGSRGGPPPGHVDDAEHTIPQDQRMGHQASETDRDEPLERVGCSRIVVDDESPPLLSAGADEAVPEWDPAIEERVLAPGARRQPALLLGQIDHAVGAEEAAGPHDGG